MTWCILGDCNNVQCHHCFPVINCSKNHIFCNLYGCCEEIKSVQLLRKVDQKPLQIHNQKTRQILYKFYNDVLPFFSTVF